MLIHLFSGRYKIGKTKFQPSWQKNRSWVTSVNGNIHQARCTACYNTDLNIESGVGIIIRHEEMQSHKDNVEKKKNN